MMENREKKSIGPAPDIVSYNAALKCYRRHPTAEGWKDSLELLKRMKARGVKPESLTYSILMNIGRKAGHLEEASNLIHVILAEGNKPHLVTFNSLAMAYISEHQYEKALEIMETLRKERVTYDRRAYELYFKSLAGTKRDEELHRTAWALFEKHLPFSRDALDMMISSMVYVGRVDEAMEIMSNIYKEKGVRPTLQTFTECFLAAGYATNVQAAVSLRREMDKWKLKPAPDTYSLIVKLCLRGKDPQTGLMMIETMCKDGIPMDLFMYNLQLKMLYSTGEADACRATIDEMK